ncbi:MAG: response regulator [Actinomycetota bacterium]
MNGTNLVLVVEDEESLAEAISYNLQREGFGVVVAGDGRKALELFRSHRPQLVLLDFMLPEISGLDVCRTLRSESAVPILVLTAKVAEADKVAGLEMGADDYMTKPFSMRELISRVRAQLRRASMTVAAGPARISAGPVQMDIERHEVWIQGRQVQFPPKEFALLETLVERTGKLVTRDSLIYEVWGSDYFGDTRTLDVHIKRLRVKIEEDPHRPKYLKTIRGLGYKFEP